MPELFDALYAIVLLALLVAHLWQQVAGRRESRRAGPLRGRVVWIERKDSGNPARPWSVVTTYAVPGHGMLIHWREFADEGRARIWQRLHPVDSVHDVIPNPRKKGFTYVPDDLAGGGNEWYWWPLLAALTASMAWVIYRLAVLE